MAVRPARPPRQQWPPRRKKNGDLSIVFFQSGRAKDLPAPLYEICLKTMSIAVNPHIVLCLVCCLTDIAAAQYVTELHKSYGGELIQTASAYIEDVNVTALRCHPLYVLLSCCHDGLQKSLKKVCMGLNPQHFSCLFAQNLVVYPADCKYGSALFTFWVHSRYSATVCARHFVAVYGRCR